MADQGQAAAEYGPFTGALTGPLTPQNEQGPGVGFPPSKAGALAVYANSFLQGAQKARRTRYERSEQTKMEQERNFDATFAHIQSDPNISKEGKDAAQTAYLQAKYSRVNEDLKKGGKDHKDNPLYNLTKAITGTVLGPTENKNHKEIDVNSLLTIATDPKFKINPAEAGGKALDDVIGGAQSISGGQQSKTLPLQPGTQQPPAARLPLQGGVGGQQPAQYQGITLDGTPAKKGVPVPVSAAPAKAGEPVAISPAAGTPPPPGTTPAAAQPPVQTPGRQVPTTQAEAWADPIFRKNWTDLTNKGIDPTASPLGQWYGSLPKAGVVKGVTAAIMGKDGKVEKYVNAARDQVTGELVDPTTRQPIPGAVEATAGLASETRATNPKLSTTAEKRQQLVDDYVNLGMTEEQAKKKVSELDTKSAEIKIQPKPTDEDKFARYFLDSGQVSDPKEANKKASEMLIALQKAKIKAAQTNAGGGGSAFAPDELNALASWSIATGQSPNFGMGKNNPDRTAYMKALAHKITGGDGIGDALGARTDFKADAGALNDISKKLTNISAFENSAKLALDNAVQASKKVPRDSSAMVNGWDQWVTKHSVDNPQLQQLFVYTETAANEYARVIGSLTGASTNAARDQANQFIRSQLGEQSFEGAADAMKTDMKNRTDMLTQARDGLRGSIANIGKKDGGKNTPAPKPDEAIDPAKKSIQLGDKTVTPGQYYKGKKILGFTKDGHLVTE